jgi:uncharacterized membrane protein
VSFVGMAVGARGTTDKALAALSKFGGTVLKTSLSEED